MQKLRDNPKTTVQEFSAINDDKDPGLHYALTYNPTDDLQIGAQLSAVRPKAVSYTHLDVYKRQAVSIKLHTHIR